jgi:hypothetical protein
MHVKRSMGAVAALAMAAVIAAACGSSSAGSSGGAGLPTSGLPSDLPGGLPGNLPAVGGGSCSVNITGDVTASWTDQQDTSSVLVTYWLGDSERAVLAMSPGDESFLFNCQSDQGAVSLYSTTDTTVAQFPEGPGTYVVPAGGILGGDDAGHVSALVTIGKDSLWRIAEPGTFTVTRLDGSKFTGSFEFKIEKLGDDLSTVEASAALSGTFDWGCSGTACG